MTVYELIEKLTKLPSHANVFVSYGNFDYMEITNVEPETDSDGDAILIGTGGTHDVGWG